jgi:hypothetical protein
MGTLNKNIAGRTVEEYMTELNKVNCKEYYEKNKDIIINKTREYYKNNKEKINETKKVYIEKNKEKIADYKHKYYEEHKAEKAICECGCETLKSTLSRHMKSKKHVELMQQKTGNII